METRDLNDLRFIADHYNELKEVATVVTNTHPGTREETGAFLDLASKARDIEALGPQGVFEDAIQDFCLRHKYAVFLERRPHTEAFWPPPAEEND
jgi:hypothetical protein